jgi:hypothetical protein
MRRTSSRFLTAINEHLHRQTDRERERERREKNTDIDRQIRRGWIDLSLSGDNKMHPAIDCSSSLREFISNFMRDPSPSDDTTTYRSLPREKASFTAKNGTWTVQIQSYTVVNGLFTAVYSPYLVTVFNHLSIPSNGDPLRNIRPTTKENRRNRSKMSNEWTRTTEEENHHTRTDFVDRSVLFIA